ncbi:MAG: hypothetical protein NTZ74_01860 [Chloroflexi bacterium]|nr:hypothetical protein [Chloroflexota bacterium]
MAYFIYPDDVENENHLTVCIAAKAGVMRSSVFSYVKTIKGTRFVGFVDTCDGASALVRNSPPDILIMDYDLNSTLADRDFFNVWVKTLVRQDLGILVIMLVNDSFQLGSMMDAGVGFAFLKGQLNDNLRNAIGISHLSRGSKVKY